MRNAINRALVASAVEAARVADELEGERENITPRPVRLPPGPSRMSDIMAALLDEIGIEPPPGQDSRLAQIAAEARGRMEALAAVMDADRQEQPTLRSLNRRLAEGRKRRASKRPYHWRRVVCVETGERFDTVQDAARSMGKWRSALAWSLANGRKCGGYHWRYADSGVENNRSRCDEMLPKV